MPTLAAGNPLLTAPSADLSREQDSLRFKALVERIEKLKAMVKGQLNTAFPLHPVAPSYYLKRLEPQRSLGLLL
jgi:hypothetical protein